MISGEQIDEFLYNLNSEGGSLVDCYKWEIRSTLNCSEDDLTEDQNFALEKLLLRGRSI